MSAAPQMLRVGLHDVEPAPSLVCIGFFDGVHRGHRTIIRRAVEQARGRGVRSAVVTFDRHPLELVRPDAVPPLLQDFQQRARALADLGPDLVVALEFDEALMRSGPETFVDRVLAGPLQTQHVVVGANFRFGHKAAGDVATLAELGPSRGFTAEGVTLLEHDGVAISSTEIRAALAEGDVRRAADMLGRPHAIAGEVGGGDRRGVALGFPTANLVPDPALAVPARGVYAGPVLLPDGSSWPAATNVGTNPTFDGTQLRVEAHLIGFHGELYGQRVEVSFTHRLRDEERFAHVDELVAQIRADVAQAAQLLGDG